MSDTSRRQRRSPLVVVLDAMLNLAAIAHAGPTPRQRIAGSTDRSRVIGRVLLVAGALVAVGGTVLLLVFVLRTPAGPALVPDPAALPAVSLSPATAPTATRSPAASHTAPAPPAASPSSLPAASRTPLPAASRSAAVPLTARYQAVSYTASLLGYRATVTITNPGSETRNGWLLTVTLPRPTLAVSVVSGATANQSGRTWIFNPNNATVRIPAGGTVQVVYDVHGATLVDAAPDDCHVDGRECTGI